MSDPWMPDSELDGMSDMDEYKNSSSPWLEDTDSDYIMDIEEEQGNVTMTEAAPPYDLTISTHVVTRETAGVVTGLSCYVTVHVRDNVGLNYVIFKFEGETDRIVYISTFDEDGNLVLAVTEFEGTQVYDFDGSLRSGEGSTST